MCALHAISGLCRGAGKGRVEVSGGEGTGVSERPKPEQRRVLG
jgi:hypothetical protein